MKKIILIFLLLVSPLSQAKTIVFIHGYMEDGMSWRNQGVTTALLKNNWLDGGALTINQYGVQKYPDIIAPLNRDVFYTIELPWTKPIGQQSQILSTYLHKISTIRQQPIALVGHSLGGVVARHYLVNNTMTPINTLITIASPHLGSPLASLAKLASQTPISKLAKSSGNHAIKESKQLFKELTPEKPNNFLYQLNHQTHPNISYLSIIRKNGKTVPGKFDYIVPPYSQNMNNTLALKGRSALFLTNKSHELTELDGWIIARFMANTLTER